METINLSVGIPANFMEEAEMANYSKAIAKSYQKRFPTTLDKVIKYIESKNFSKEKKADLIKQAKKCPTGAFGQFCKNI